jgi:hypothetical protein
MTLNPDPIENEGYWFEQSAVIAMSGLTAFADPWLACFLGAVGDGGVFFTQPSGQSFSDGESNFEASISATEAGVPGLFPQSTFLQQVKAAYDATPRNTNQLLIYWGECRDFTASGGTKGYWQPVEEPLKKHHLYTGDGYASQGYLGTRYT